MGIEFALNNLCKKMSAQSRVEHLTYSQFLDLFTKAPLKTTRDIFQLTFDCFNYYAKRQALSDREANDSEFYGFYEFDTTNLFVDNVDEEVFTDQLFDNRLYNALKELAKSNKQNQMLVIEGPPGSGKSRVLNAFLKKITDYLETEEGKTYEYAWKLDYRQLGIPLSMNGDGPYFKLVCPNHCHPIYLIPKKLRSDFFKNLFGELSEQAPYTNKNSLDEKTRFLFSLQNGNRDLLTREKCTICDMVETQLLKKGFSYSDILSMVEVKERRFRRSVSDGISVFNPDDRDISESHSKDIGPLVEQTNTNIQSEIQTNNYIQKKLNLFFKHDNGIFYVYSQYAGVKILALQDLKHRNVTRLNEWHNFISEGLHKVHAIIPSPEGSNLIEIEENINSLIIALVNPEDKHHLEKMGSYVDRITVIKQNYCLHYQTEVKIYRNIFGKKIDDLFLPNVLENFSKCIIASRLNKHSKVLDEIVSNPSSYRSFCDKDLLLLKMELYMGNIPGWLSDEDRKKFTKVRRKRLIQESETEGESGITGRDSIRIFNDLMNSYCKLNRKITMRDVLKFFRAKNGNYSHYIGEDFLSSVEKFYHNQVSQQLKDSLSEINDAEIKEQVKDYLFMINFDNQLNTKINPLTGKKIDYSEDFLTEFETIVLDKDKNEYTFNIAKKEFRSEQQKKFVTDTLAQGIAADPYTIEKTSQFIDLFVRFRNRKKETVLDSVTEPLLNAIKEYSTDNFKSYDQTVQRRVIRLINNLCRLKYSEKDAQEISIYAISLYLNHPV